MNKITIEAIELESGNTCDGCFLQGLEECKYIVCSLMDSGLPNCHDGYIYVSSQLNKNKSFIIARKESIINSLFCEIIHMKNSNILDPKVLESKELEYMKQKEVLKNLKRESNK